jgi:hypothetical protein
MKTISNYLGIFLSLGIMAVTVPSCDESVSTTDPEEMKQVDPPTIIDFSPASGPAGTEIVIGGTNLGSIDNVWIGDSGVRIKNRVSQEILVAEVTSDAKTGKIKVQNKAGTAESNASFTVEYLIPELTDFPATAIITEPVLLRGTSLQAVKAVYFGENQGRITTQLTTELLVVMPTQPMSVTTVDVRLIYATVAGDQETGTQGAPVTVERVIPDFTKVPGKGNAGSLVTVLGNNLSIIEKVYIDTVGMLQPIEIPVTQASKNSFSFELPGEDVFSKNTMVTVTASYYETELIVVNPSFGVTIPGQETVYFWANVTLECQKNDATNAFFIAETGTILSPCDYVANIDNIKEQIDFYTTWSGSGLQLNNPANSASQTKNFKCDGIALPGEVLPKVVKFRVLDPTNARQLALINSVKNQDIIRITADMIAGIPNAGASAPRAYPPGTSGGNPYMEGDVLMFQLFDGTTVLKTGFMEIVKVNFGSPTNESTLTFNCYYEK